MNYNFVKQILNKEIGYNLRNNIIDKYEKKIFVLNKIKIFLFLSSFIFVFVFCFVKDMNYFYISFFLFLSFYIFKFFVRRNFKKLLFLLKIIDTIIENEQGVSPPQYL